MVGMEKVEVLSKSYLVRWIHVKAGHTISWSLQPDKKSLNFGIFKHPGGTTAQGLPNTPIVPAETSIEAPSATGDAPEKTKRWKFGRSTTSDKLPGLDKAEKGDRHEQSTIIQKLEAVGMKSVAWSGKCEADKVSIGQFDVLDGEGGMYGLVFDNTFSKQVSKTATFVLMTYPTATPPTSGHHLHFSQAATESSTSLAKSSPALGASTDSLHAPATALAERRSSHSVAADPRPRSRRLVETKTVGGSSFYTGVMHKRKRKHNSYARRFFSLDFTTGTLSYYRNRQSSALRGAIPLSLAAVAMNEHSREISVDSGAEIWHLRVGNQRDFDGWKQALGQASRAVVAADNARTPTTSRHASGLGVVHDPEEEREWNRVETLVGRVSGIRDAVRRIARDTDPKYLPSSGLHSPGPGGLGINVERSPARSPSTMSIEFLPGDEGADKRPFIKRRPSFKTLKRTFSSQSPTTSTPPIPPLPPSSVPTSAPVHGKLRIPQKHYFSSETEVLHENCLEVLRDIDQVVGEFTSLIGDSKLRRRRSAQPRRSSIISTSSDEFFDAEDNGNQSGLLQIRRDSQEDLERDNHYSDDVSSSSASISDSHDVVDRRTVDENARLFPARAKSMAPLPLDPVQHRTSIKPPSQPPVSLISFLRKNVGKDLSTIAMPVGANEPNSALQRFSEQLEYSELLDAAAAHDDPAHRLLRIAAFAVSNFSSLRVKERVLRKPFNPLLGETFELVREDKGFRLLAEKISHRPMRLAMQAESHAAGGWTFLHAPLPVQKFWGKSAELNTEGRARVFLHARAEVFSYTAATSFLRNVIAGEKYVEPVATMSVLNESSGARALVSFKAGGMFAGRSEEVSITLTDAHGASLPLGAHGKWTSGLAFTHNGSTTTGDAVGDEPLWIVDALVPHPERNYGFTTFAASLNEITSTESAHLPPTDSRLRPDQRLWEDGSAEAAEQAKARLEEAQRARRKELEERGEEWTPRWFAKTGRDGGEDVWRLVAGQRGYWECRERREWEGVVDLFGGESGE